jgi:hypothetical protein
MSVIVTQGDESDATSLCASVCGGADRAGAEEDVSDQSSMGVFLIVSSLCARARSETY